MLNNRFAKEYNAKPIKRAGGFIPTSKSHGSVVSEHERLPSREQEEPSARDLRAGGLPPYYIHEQDGRVVRANPPYGRYEQQPPNNWSYSDLPPDMASSPLEYRRPVMQREVPPSPPPSQPEEQQPEQRPQEVFSRPPPLRRVDKDTPKRTAVVTPCFRSTCVSDVEDLKLDQYAYLAMRDSRDKHKESPLAIRALMNPIPGTMDDVVEDSEEARKRIFAWLDASDHVVIYSDLAMTPFMSEVVLWGNRNDRAIEFRFLGDEWLRWRHTTILKSHNHPTEPEKEEEQAPPATPAPPAIPERKEMKQEEEKPRVDEPEEREKEEEEEIVTAPFTTMSFSGGSGSTTSKKKKSKKDN